LLLYFCPRPFFESDNPKSRFVERRHALIGVEVKAGKGPAMRVEIARGGKQ
jgi:hypothetical protein